MRLYGKLVKNTLTIKEALIVKDDNNRSFRDILEECLIGLCKELDIQVPLWLDKNTSEFAAYRRTFFTPEQFFEEVAFDRFEIKIM